MRRLYAILKSVAPQAQEAIKWRMPFFVEPRFLFSFSAHKAHCNFALTAAALEAFRKEQEQEQEQEQRKTTTNFLQIPYDESLPEDLVRKIPENPQTRDCNTALRPRLPRLPRLRRLHGFFHSRQTDDQGV